MIEVNITTCPGCLKPGYTAYCKKCRTKLFDGKPVSHILPFSRPEFNIANLKQGIHLSISGVQVKHSLKIERNQLILTEQNGEYILKPVPSGQFQNLDQVPANEHLTMQIASNVYKIKAAENAVIFFGDGEIAYITRRFDVLPSGRKLLQEDFAQIAGLSEERGGQNYKYNFSYEEIAGLIKEHVRAYPVEMEKYFRVVVFNYLFSNGDSHVKNFSLFRNEEYKDYLLTPFYDLLNTALHVPLESDLALDLFRDGYETEAYSHGTKFTKPDFYEFAKRIGISEKRFNVIYNAMLQSKQQVEEYVGNSYLAKSMQHKYLESYHHRLKRLER